MSSRLPLPWLGSCLRVVKLNLAGPVGAKYVAMSSVVRNVMPWKRSGPVVTASDDDDDVKCLVSYKWRGASS